MPKILVKETDLTSPGTAGRYENYSVLIAGTWGHKYVVTEDDGVTITTITPGSRAFADEAADYVKLTNPEYELANIDSYNAKLVVQPDSNGVYEFTSVEQFLATIGQAAPIFTVKEGTLTSDVAHYGNQMACELLKMGYPVIYKPFNIKDVKDLGDDSFWAIFRDKANYDFRFVSHGLLTSTVDSTDTTNIDDRIKSISTAKDSLESLFAAEVVKVSGLPAEAVTYEFIETNGSFPQTDNTELSAMYETLEAACETAFDALRNGTNTAAAIKEGLTLPDNDAATYTEFNAAVKGIRDELTSLDELKDALSIEGIISTNLINQANEKIINLASYIPRTAAEEDNNTLPGRGDCVALLELDERQYVPENANDDLPEIRIIKAVKMLSADKAKGKFAALTVPSVEYTMTPEDYYEDNTKFPAAFHYLSCFKNSLNGGFKEWYAAAGYTRGVSLHTVKTTSVKLGEIAINALEPRYKIGKVGSVEPPFASNVIAYFRGSYYLWGNRTAHPLGSLANNDDLVASSFLNIRQLCTTIKKQLYVACRKFTFDPNSDTLWINFVNAIKPTLELMKADQGIRDYRVVKVFTDKKATLKAKIRIIPIEAVEDFDLEISLEDAFGETNAIATE